MRNARASKATCPRVRSTVDRPVDISGPQRSHFGCRFPDGTRTRQAHGANCPGMASVTLQISFASDTACQGPNLDRRNRQGGGLKSAAKYWPPRSSACEPWGASSTHHGLRFSSDRPIQVVLVSQQEECKVKGVGESTVPTAKLLVRRPRATPIEAQV